MSLKTTLKNLLARLKNRLFPPKHSVDSLTAGLTTHITKLEAAAAHHRNEAARQYALSDTAEEAGDRHVDEAARAIRIAGRVGSLVA